VVTQQGLGDWRRFSPEKLLPFGGFGDPAISDLVWKPPRGLEVDKLDLARAQDRLARALRTRINEMGISEAELEDLLGYKRGYLVRKLNGIEAVTTRDIIRIGRAFGSSIIATLGDDNPEFPEPKSKGRR